VRGIAQPFPSDTSLVREVHNVRGVAAGHSVTHLLLRDTKYRVKPRRLPPVMLEGLREARRSRNDCACRLHACAELAELTLRGPLVLLAAVIRYPAGDLESREAPRRRPDCLGLPRLGERDPRLDPRPRPSRGAAR
jgi:hypothetical protein